MSESAGAGRRPTFTEEARRRQIVDGTIALIADRGYAGASLSAIAGRSGISKAGVLYHFAGKDQVIAAALGHVVEQVVTVVGERVDAAAGPAGMLDAYVRGMLEHLHAHPTHVRVLVEVLGQGGSAQDGGPADRTGRWEAVAGILAAGQQAGEFRMFDTRVMALVIGGAMDGVLVHWLTDPAFDLAAATDELVTSVRLAVRAQ